MLEWELFLPAPPPNIHGCSSGTFCKQTCSLKNKRPCASGPSFKWCQRECFEFPLERVSDNFTCIHFHNYPTMLFFFFLLISMWHPALSSGRLLDGRTAAFFCHDRETFMDIKSILISSEQVGLGSLSLLEAPYPACWIITSPLAAALYDMAIFSTHPSNFHPPASAFLRRWLGQVNRQSHPRFILVEQLLFPLVFPRCQGTAPVSRAKYHRVLPDSQNGYTLTWAMKPSMTKGLIAWKRGVIFLHIEMWILNMNETFPPPSNSPSMSHMIHMRHTCSSGVHRLDSSTDWFWEFSFPEPA